MCSEGEALAASYEDEIITSSDVLGDDDRSPRNPSSAAATVAEGEEEASTKISMLSEDTVVEMETDEEVSQLTRDEEAQAALHVPSSPHKRPGRRRDPIWNKFRSVRVEDGESSSSFDWYCKSCGDQVSAQVPRLKEHYKSCVLGTSISSNKKQCGRQKSHIWKKFDKVQLDGESEPGWVCKICARRVSAAASRLESHYKTCLARKKELGGLSDTKNAEQCECVCTLCGIEFEKRQRLQQGLFSIWAMDCSDSMAEFLAADSSQLKFLRDASYCTQCSLLTTDIDFLIRSIRSFQSSLSFKRTQIQKIVTKNHSWKKNSTLKEVFTNFLSEDSGTALNHLQHSVDASLLRKPSNEVASKLELKRKLIQKRQRFIRLTNTVDSADSTRSQSVQPKIEVLEGFHETSQEEADGAEEKDPDFDPESDPELSNSSSPDFPEVRQPLSDDDWTITSSNHLNARKRRKVRKSTRRFKVLICSAEDSSKDSLAGPRRLKCEEDSCQFRCNKKETMEVHVRSIHLKDPTPYHCTSCNRKFKSYISLHYHERRWHKNGATPRPCPVAGCGKKFIESQTLENHVKWKHYGYDRKKCQFCGLSFLNEDVSPLEEHEQKHRDAEIPFSCVVPACASSFTNFHDLKKHVTTTHEEMTLRCDLCPEKIFISFASLRVHKNRTHKEIISSGRVKKVKELLRCPQEGCKFTTDMQSTLLNHQSTHVEGRPHMCDECGNTYKTEQALKRHKFLHSGENPYKCKYCPKSFNLGHKLKNHEETHAPTLSYLCSGCGKAFRSKKNLNQHTTHHCPHSQKKPYKKSTPTKRKSKNATVIEEEAVSEEKDNGGNKEEWETVVEPHPQNYFPAPPQFTEPDESGQQFLVVVTEEWNL